MSRESNVDEHNTLLSFLYHLVFDEDFNKIFRDSGTGRQELERKYGLSDAVKKAINNASNDPGHFQTPVDPNIQVLLNELEKEIKSDYPHVIW